MPSLLMKAAAGIIACLATPCAAESLLVNLAPPHVEIGSTFEGGQVYVFGLVDGVPDGRRAEGYDVVITIRGPSRSMVVREKSRTGIIWANSDSQRFVDVPSYLWVLANRPTSKMAEPARIAQLGLSSKIVLANASGLSGDRARFIDAFYSLRREDGMIGDEPGGVQFLTDRVFRAQISLPANAPPGSYGVEVSLLRSGSLLDRQTSYFGVLKKGIDFEIFRYSRTAGFLYGLVLALIAIATGSAVALMFRRG